MYKKDKMGKVLQPFTFSTRIGEADGIPYLFFHDQGRIKTIYPKWTPQ